jgi:thioredoxin-related protein
MRTPSPSRRSLLHGALAGLVAGPARGAEPTPGDDGLFHPPWMLETFLDLGEDVESATKNGRRLAMIWEQRGCPYCRDMHLINFADPAIVDYLRAHFDVVQLDTHGAREMTDFDGAKLSEKAFAARYGIRVTPTIQFFPDSPTGLSAKSPMARESARMPGYLPPREFLAMFRFVHERAYERTGFQEFLTKGAG